MNDTAPSVSVPVPSSPAWRGALRVVAAAAFCSGFLFGYDTAVINGANRYLVAHFALTPLQEGMAGASAILGCIPGATCAGFIADRFGRRKTLFICALLYGISGLLSAMPSTFGQFLGARFIGGVGIGASSMSCPVYVAELAPKAWRGRLGSMFQFGIVCGIFLTLFVNAQIQTIGDESWNTAIGWRWMLGAETLPALVLLVILYFAPESPRWLLERGRAEEGRKVLARVVGPVEAEAEAAAVLKGRAAEVAAFRDLFVLYRRPALIAVVLMAVSQFSGINAVMYYSTKIFLTAGVGVGDSFAASAIIGLVNLVFTLVAVALVDKAGRRTLLLIGLSIQSISLILVGWVFRTDAGRSALLAAVLAYIAAFAMSLGPVPWILCSEIFPNRVRGRAMSLATFVIWVSCFVVAQTFPWLNAHPRIGPSATFWLYAVCTLCGLLFVFAVVPETKGRSLEDIEQIFQH